MKTGSSFSRLCIIVALFMLVSLCLIPSTQAELSPRQEQSCGDGALVFFRSRGNANELWKVQLDDNTLTRYFPTEHDSAEAFTISATTPAQSGANWRIAFTGMARSGYQDIYILELSHDNTLERDKNIPIINLTGGSTNLFSPASRESHPSWSPDGSQIVFAADNGSNNFDLWIISADGTGVKQLTNTPDINEFSPAWSPDGSRIAYASDENKINEISFDAIRIISLQDRTLAPLYFENLAQPLPVDEFWPAWSSQGWIAFTRREGESSKIYLVNTNDPQRQPQPLISDADNVRLTAAWPTWSLDGQYLAFAAMPFEGSMPAHFDLYTVKVFDDANNPLFPVTFEALCQISLDELRTSDEFNPLWIG
jgi:Tol biopolymer transport system component